MPKKGIASVIEKRRQEDSESRRLAAEIVFSLLPGGTTATKLLQAIFQPSITERRNQWIERLAHDIHDLCQRVDDLEVDQLSQDEVFITTALQASQIALRNHQEEKLLALRNSILNSALPSAPVDALQQMYLRFIDDFTEWHLRLLTLVEEFKSQRPNDLFRAQEIYYDGKVLEGVTNVYPELEGEIDFCRQVWKDLESKGLVIRRTVDNWDSYTVSSLGIGFLNYITRPSILAEDAT